ncbi:hypothetical protein EKO23_03580 [Nocardioides guangzhouensis]|uniref:Uncharacterized protein n=1 Tax=Nocardioides guangzhouensis TaxID=2497878 RepID=A0A4Q4ZJF0_9ACTN|nr:hypothetical protein [Nocardioides guangzhouensis]RYP88417.1 hypothetical protein EKO23_03580 [Nocardioides guangzhouensis]
MTRDPRWEEQLFALFDDLEQQAEAAFAAEREGEVAEQARSAYAEVALAARLMAAVGAPVSLTVEGVGALEGTLQRVAAGWCLLDVAGQGWIVRLPAVQVVRGLPARSVAEAAWPVTARLGLGSALRRVAEARDPCRLLLRDGTTYDARLGRVGADFVEAHLGETPPGTRTGPVLVAFTALAAVHPL